MKSLVRHWRSSLWKWNEINVVIIIIAINVYCIWEEEISVQRSVSRARNPADIVEGNGGRNKYSLPAYLQSIIVVLWYSGSSSSSSKQERRRVVAVERQRWQWEPKSVIVTTRARNVPSKRRTLARLCMPLFSTNQQLDASSDTHNIYF